MGRLQRGASHVHQDQSDTLPTPQFFDDLNPYATPSSHSSQLPLDDFQQSQHQSDLHEYDYAHDDGSNSGQIAGSGAAAGGYYSIDGAYHAYGLSGMAGGASGLGGAGGLAMGMGMSLDAMTGRALLHQPLQYHLYQPPLPHVSLAPSQAAVLQHFFMSPTLRQDLLLRQSVQATAVPMQRLAWDQPDVPREERPLGRYWGFIPLDKKYPPEQVRVDSLGRVVGGSLAASIYGYRHWTYRASDEESAKLVVVRRVEGFRLASEHAIQTVEKWSRLHHPNIVGVKEAFTSRAFGDSCGLPSTSLGVRICRGPMLTHAGTGFCARTRAALVFVYDYHPLSSTLLEVHLTNPTRGSAPPPPIPERVLWSYMVQVSSSTSSFAQSANRIGHSLTTSAGGT